MLVTTRTVLLRPQQRNKCFALLVVESHSFSSLFSSTTTTLLNRDTCTPNRHPAPLLFTTPRSSTTTFARIASFRKNFNRNSTTSSHLNNAARNMSSSSTDDVTATAIRLLKDTPFFYNASDSLLQTLATKCRLWMIENTESNRSHAQFCSFCSYVIWFSQWFQSPLKRDMYSSRKGRSCPKL